MWERKCFTSEVEEAKIPIYEKITNRQKVMREENNLTHAKREIKETKDKLKTTKRKRNHFFQKQEK